MVSAVSRYMDNLCKIHLMVAMKVLKYMKGTNNFNVKYEVENEAKLIKYLDND